MPQQPAAADLDLVDPAAVCRHQQRTADEHRLPSTRLFQALPPNNAPRVGDEGGDTAVIGRQHQHQLRRDRIGRHAQRQDAGVDADTPCPAQLAGLRIERVQNAAGQRQGDPAVRGVGLGCRERWNHQHARQRVLVDRARAGAGRGRLVFDRGSMRRPSARAARQPPCRFSSQCAGPARTLLHPGGIGLTDSLPDGGDHALPSDVGLLSLVDLGELLVLDALGLGKVDIRWRLELVRLGPGLARQLQRLAVVKLAGLVRQPFREQLQRQPERRHGDP